MITWRSPFVHPPSRPPHRRPRSQRGGPRFEVHTPPSPPPCALLYAAVGLCLAVLSAILGAADDGSLEGVVPHE